MSASLNSSSGLTTSSQMYGDEDSLVGCTDIEKSPSFGSMSNSIDSISKVCHKTVPGDTLVVSSTKEPVSSQLIKTVVCSGKGLPSDICTRHQLAEKFQVDLADYVKKGENSSSNETCSKEFKALSVQLVHDPSETVYLSPQSKFAENVKDRNENENETQKHGTAEEQSVIENGHENSPQTSMSSFTRDLLELRKKRQEFRRNRNALKKQLKMSTIPHQAVSEMMPTNAKKEVGTDKPSSGPPTSPFSYFDMRQWLWTGANQPQYFYAGLNHNPEVYSNWQMSMQPPTGAVQTPITRDTLPSENPFAYPPFCYWKTPQRPYSCSKANDKQPLSFEGQSDTTIKRKVSVSTVRMSQVDEYLRNLRLDGGSKTANTES